MRICVDPGVSRLLDQSYCFTLKDFLRGPMHGGRGHRHRRAIGSPFCTEYPGPSRLDQKGYPAVLYSDRLPEGAVLYRNRRLAPDPRTCRN